MKHEPHTTTHSVKPNSIISCSRGTSYRQNSIGRRHKVSCNSLARLLVLDTLLPNNKTGGRRPRNLHSLWMNVNRQQFVIEHFPIYAFCNNCVQYTPKIQSLSFNCFGGAMQYNLWVAPLESLFFSVRLLLLFKVENNIVNSCQYNTNVVSMHVLCPLYSIDIHDARCSW